ncbi:MAG: peptide chain release factor N(5)-glutamine methyltransferase [Xanthobacteraceae bacterium]
MRPLPKLPSAAAGTPAAAADDTPAVTVAEARRAWAARFRVGGIDAPELDARILIGRALCLDHAGLAAAEARALTASERSAIAALARRRLAREPVARIVGSKEFWSLTLALGAETLVPRPETETVVEAVLAALGSEKARAGPLRIADLGTGSGALLLALLSELPNAFGVGTDVSAGALDIARANAGRLGLSRAAFVACDIATALGGTFDIVVSNPPYVVSGEIADLPAEVRLFDPPRALDGGADGLDFYRAIAVAAPTLLAPGGLVAVELGAGQSGPVAALFAAAGLAPASPCPDLNGVPRALIAREL